MPETYLSNRDGNRSSPGQAFVRQLPWVEIGELTTAQATITTSAQATVEALTATGVVFKILDDGTVAAKLRFRSEGSSNDAVVIEIYGLNITRNDQAIVSGNDNITSATDFYTKKAVIALTVGAGVANTDELFVDTIVPSVELWHGSANPASPADDTIAEYSFNTSGLGKLLIIATTLTGPSKLNIDMVSF